MERLSRQHWLFIEAFNGENEVEAMQIAGYAGDPSYLRSKAKILLNEPLVIEAIQNRERYSKARNKAIADREELGSWWTSIMRNQDPHYIEEVYPDTNAPKPRENLPLQQRMKASEMIGKMHGMFVDNVNLHGQLTITDVIQKSYAIPDDDLDAIEAEYELLREQAQIAEKEPATPKPEPVQDKTPGLNFF